MRHTDKLRAKLRLLLYCSGYTLVLTALWVYYRMLWQWQTGLKYGMPWYMDPPWEWWAFGTSLAVFIITLVIDYWAAGQER